ncbi:MAG TPA: hypothetical protein VFL77_04650 [Solirubrobacterales bacterium]|nr:hypothetical protein [Solirubrobacterales bacterium]
MRKRVVLTIALVMALCAAVAGRVLADDAPISVRSGNIKMSIQATGWPGTLPKDRFIPVAFLTAGDISTVDGSHPPALEEVIVDIGSSGVGVNADQFPTCTALKLAGTTTQQAEKTCHDAIVGRGSGAAEVEFSEQKPFTATSPLVIFNGGEKNGKVLMLIHAYAAVPTPTAFVAKVITTKEHKGPYSLHTVGKIPEIAGGAGSITHFSLYFERNGYLVSNCSTGHFTIHVTSKYHDGTTVKGNIIRGCART